MKKFKILIILVAILMIANCVLIGLLWYNNYHQNPNAPPPAPMQGPAFEYLTRELKLTPGQVKKYDTLRRQHMEFTQKTGGGQRLMRDSFFDNMKNPDSNPAEVALLEKRILVKQGQLDSATFYHFRSFRKILNAGQAVKFDSIINNVLHMMGQPHPQGGRGPGGQMGTNSAPIDGPQGQAPSSSPQDRKPGKHRMGPDGKPLPRRPPNGQPPMGPPPDGRPWPPPPGSGPPPNGGPPPGGGPPPQGQPLGQ